MKEVFQCQLLLGGESELQRENKVEEENEKSHGTLCVCVWSNVGYMLKRALSVLEAQQPNLRNTNIVPKTFNRINQSLQR